MALSWFFVLIAWFLNQSDMRAFEPGLYSAQKDSNIAMEILWLRKYADLSIGCMSADQLDIGVRGENSKVIYFSRAELLDFFNLQRHKSLLFVHLHPNAVKNAEKDLEIYFAPLKYKRILIVRGTGTGNIVLRDIFESNAK